MDTGGDMNSSEYTDAKGRRWLLVGTTLAGVYGWFRPVKHADDGYYDKSFKIAYMRAALAKAGA
jgi:hypothetical protein